MPALAVHITAECRNRCFIFVNVHGLYNEQVVVQGYNGVDQRNEYQQVEAAAECRHENEEFTKETCKRWNSGE